MSTSAYFALEPLLVLCARRAGVTVDELRIDDVAALCSVDGRTVSRWKAERRLPTMTADRVACALGLHPSAIWGREWFEGET